MSRAKQLLNIIETNYQARAKLTKLVEYDLTKYTHIIIAHNAFDKKDILKQNKFWWFADKKVWGKPYNGASDERTLEKLMLDNKIDYQIMPILPDASAPKDIKMGFIKWGKKEPSLMDAPSPKQSPREQTRFDLNDPRLHHDQENDMLYTESSDLGWKAGFWPDYVGLKDTSPGIGTFTIYNKSRQEIDNENELLWVEYKSEDGQMLRIYND